MRRHLPSLERLRTLREVARTGSFSAAAETLGLTQPAVSNQIRQLEQEAGARLLERIGRNARPTPEGMALIAAADLVLGVIEDALDEILRMRADVAGGLVLATGATATRYLLPDVISDLTARHPAIDLRIVTGNTADLVTGIRDGSIDIGLLTAPVEGPQIEQRFHYRDHLLCIAPPGQAPAKTTVGPMDLEGHRLVLFDRAGSIRRAIDGWLDAADRARIRITDIGSSDAQVAYVGSGFGWSVISEMATREAAAAGLVEVRRLDPPIYRDLVLAWRRDRESLPAIAAALAVFGEYAEPNGCL
ncbi:MAG: LysR family transcriptional regulator [Thalassobaculum sp.]|uniref:LysR family transcriptional regulator n=1 Tax=Thalassobaculum sp. TaxID=2022740 RepID=UPI0032ED5767